MKEEQEYIQNLIERRQSICLGCNKNLTNGMGMCVDCMFDRGGGRE